VLGPCGSGKSTLAARLAEHLGVEATHIDDIHHQPGWVEAPEAETRARIAQVVARPRWVIDGNYTRFREPHADRIQLYVYLDLPLCITFPRLVKRGIRRSLTKEPCCNGNTETLARTFFHRESLLLWALTGSLRHRARTRRHVCSRPHVRLRSARQVERWLAGVIPTRP